MKVVDEAIAKKLVKEHGISALEEFDYVKTKWGLIPSRFYAVVVEVEKDGKSSV